MKKTYVSALALFLAVTLQATPVFAGVSTPTKASCDAQAYVQSLNMSAKPIMREVVLDRVHIRIPYSSLWKVGGMKLARTENTSLSEGEARYSFGSAFASPLSECEYERAYTLNVKNGITFNIEKTNMDARVELIGSNTVTILRRTGDTDCPGESAVLLKAGKILTFQKTCSTLDAESRKIIASIR